MLHSFLHLPKLQNYWLHKHARETSQKHRKCADYSNLRSKSITYLHVKGREIYYDKYNDDK